jgi:iron complex transport system substrate-binding protein
MTATPQKRPAPVDVRIKRRAFLVLLFLAAHTFAAPAQRIVSLSAPLTETIYFLGAQDRLLAVSDVSVFPEQVLKDRRAGRVRELGSFVKPDLAAIDALHPDIILTSTAFQRALAEQLRGKGYRVLHYEPRTLMDVFASIEEIGEAIGKKKEAWKRVAEMQRELDGIRRKSAALPPVRVYLEVNHEGPWTAGAMSPLNDLIRAAGGENIFGDRDSGVFVVSHEEIVRRNPDVILSPVWEDAKVGGIDGIIPLAQIMMRPGYADTSAVRNSRVLYYDSALFKHEGPRQILAIRKLAHLLHPDVFEDPPGTIPWELGRIRP